MIDEEEDDEELEPVHADAWPDRSSRRAVHERGSPAPCPTVPVADPHFMPARPTPLLPLRTQPPCFFLRVLVFDARLSAVSTRAELRAPIFTDSCGGAG